MFAKFEAVKISSIEFQGILKEQKQNLEVCKADCCYSLLRRQVAENKLVVERAEAECGEASFCWRK